MNFKKEENKAFTTAIILSNNYFSERDDTDSNDNWSDEENDWEDEDINNKKTYLGLKLYWLTLVILYGQKTN